MTRHAVIAGAGLAGSLAAGYLARRGYSVRVFERRGDPRAAGAGEGRSINLGLSARGMRALAAAGLLDDVLARSVPMRGRVVHHPDGTTAFQPYGVAAHQILYSVLRRDLNALLVDAAETRHGVTFHFGHRLDRIDRDAPAVRVVDAATGAATEVAADLVVGADGAFSAVREQLQHGRRADLHREFLDWGYKELTIPAGADGRPRVRLDALHVWPGQAAMMVAHPNVDGSLTCTLFAPFEGEPSLATLDTPAAVRGFVRRYFPDAEALMPRLVEEFFDHPVGQLTTVRTAPWRHAGKVVLVGDACHAVYPFYGQGMNSAFEDCLVLDECLGAYPYDASRALAEYERRRRPHTDVLADLSVRNFVELRDRVHRPAYAAKAAADRMLNRLAPRAWTPLYTMVAHTTVPYADALARARRQDRILRCSAALAAAGAAIGSYAALRRRPGRR
ncbi:FAD-dependent oxidoreductase [Couchioplanes caeruleus]|uniref:Kynurenine 3-monooxygenase n=2 Tax=Couchioplanes caeruleus TaxID=56438 RepID=A0A1K0FSV3_9ACTN|nr:NAD(P)/FAD-dependent oxidoreductase [Couchioplanes caeruleus]OJF15885.1 kynurenine 3-monooxygenase [Couchioplanes caeruleus subsp. caeruleus]ROP28452.1 kynurenine 3-monooxygenase [Couchioplanes caeruleus]